MRKYNITVNGTTYEVEVEEVDPGSIKSIKSSASKPVPTPSPLPESKIEEKPRLETPKESKASSTETINAPMPGSIVDVKVSVGDTVSEGDTLLILEAMKMDNEIMAPRDGKITEVNASKGQTVNTGDSLISLE